MLSKLFIFLYISMCGLETRRCCILVFIPKAKATSYFVLCNNVGMLAVDVDASNVFFNMNVAYT